jgi:hypothetical protein
LGWAKQFLPRVVRLTLVLQRRKASGPVRIKATCSSAS